MTVFSQISKLWRGRRDPETEKGSTEAGLSGDLYAIDPKSGKTTLDEFFDAMFGNKSRQQLYQIYRDIEESTPEIASGLDIYADYAVSGGTEHGTSSIRLTSRNRTFDRRLRRIDQNVRISSHAWQIVRCMCQYGDSFYENIYSAAGLQKLKVLPRRELYRQEDVQGRLRGYVQKPERQNADPIEFTPWQVSHFRLQVDEEEKYGRSILWAIKREALELMLMRSGMTITRLSRAHRRLVHNIDIGDASSESEVQAILAAAKARNRRQRIIDPRTGRMSLRANPLRAEEDIYVPSRKDGQSNVSVLKGDDSLKTIEDVLFKRAGLLAGLKMSESWLGLTGPNVRNVADHQVINFLKTIRRVRKDFAKAAIVPYQIGLMLQGVPWQRVFLGDIDLAFPKMSIVEDKLRLELDELRTKVSKELLAQELMTRLDILVLVYDLSVEEAQRLLTNVEKEQEPDTTDDSLSETRHLVDTVKESALQSLKDRIEERSAVDPYLAERVDIIRFLIDEIRESVEYRGLGNGAPT